VRKAPSLAVRLALCLLAVQFVGAVITTLAIELFVEDDAVVFFKKNRNELAVPRVHLMVTDSLKRGPDGGLSIDPSPDLLAERNRAPAMLVAVFDPKTRTPLAGSSPELVAQLNGLRHIRTYHMHFVFEGETRKGMTGHLSLTPTQYGDLIFATYGHRFRWIDLFHSLKYEVTSYQKYFMLEVLISIAIGWLAFRRGLAPLNQVAREAERIDLDSLHQRLPLERVPAEVTPLVKSINGALARLDDGAERQRRFLANAAHELRTPVAILMERLDEPMETGVLTKLRGDAERIRNIVEQLLAAVRLDRGHGRPDEICDLACITESIVDDHALIAVKMKRQLALETDGQSSFIRGDRFAVQSILANLIHNALRAEPEGGTVVVRLGRGVGVEVADHGEGVATEDREKIFEPFWRKSEATPGSGLGLAIAKELIEKLGGRIWVESTPGGGATFKVTFSEAANF
jgi:signal transduction histidine kinase